MDWYVLFFSVSACCITIAANLIPEQLDQRALLAVQHACSQDGIKIPWAKVGQLLGSSITEGALVQHLAKLRNKLDEDGVQVVPSLKRGGKAANSKGGNNKTVTNNGAVAKRTYKPRAPAKGNKAEAVDDSYGDYDSDGERIGKKKRNARPKKTKAASTGKPYTPKKGKTLSKEKPSAKGKSGPMTVKVESGEDSSSKSSMKKDKDRKCSLSGLGRSVVTRRR